MADIKSFVKFFKNPLSVIGALIISALVMAAIFAPVLATHPPNEIVMADKLAQPSPAHYFGTDEMGRDIYSRIVYGSRISLQVGMQVVGIAISIGVFTGAVSGYYGGWIDEIIMRITDMFLAFPSMILAMAIAAALGPSLSNAVIASSITWWPWYTRMVRSQILALREAEFVEAARASGNTMFGVIIKYILPNCLSPLIVQATMDVGFAIQLTAGLSFIGLGAQPPTADWGSMLSTGRKYMLTHWWYVTFPGLFIFLVVLGFNLLGDGLRDHLDPKLKNTA
ncbi:MAG: ABC transporter permease [Eubacteriaceae bacterium]|nr:ABC transporter permease [Eubacteriaceae bacterium]